MSTVDSIIGAGAAEQNIYTQSTDAGSNNNGAAAGEETFAGVLSDALNDLTDSMLTNAVNTNMSSAMGPGPDSLSAFGYGMSDTMFSAGNPMAMAMPAISSSLEQAITNAAATGQKDDAMMALLMLMMMMQANTGNGGGEMGMMMMQMMAAMIGQMQEKQAIYEEFRRTPDIAPQVLDAVDTGVFQAEEAGMEGITDEQYLPLQWWKPATARLTSDEFDRSAGRYRAVLDQFQVETAERYRPGREGHTYCNVYVWDATRAMGAEIPYYTDPATGAPREYPDVAGASYNGARAMDRWLKSTGAQYGWRQVDAEQAQMQANMGKPVVASGADIGHISMVAPSNDGSFDPVRGVVVAQAGSTVTNYMHISGIYGAAALRDKVTYWVHD